ncbi:MAG: aminotransferase class I/II-fold pyridoxal phosphate-dependent enzyme, partial [Oscillospiraceae bacterium]
MKNKAFIPLSIPNICGNELEYITRTVQAGWVSTSSPIIGEFEDRVAKYLSIQNACACQSATAGIHLCLRHFGIGSKDIVLVPTITFIATINAVAYQSATPVFFDCDENLCISATQILEYIETYCTFDGTTLTQTDSGEIVKAIIPVHIFGATCNMDYIMDIAEKYHLIVIEDAAQSIGTRFAAGRYCGKQTGTVGHAGVISFNGNKIITTGGGGMVVSNDKKVTEHIRYLSQQAKDNALHFIHSEVGYNYRMTSIQAAMGM